MDVVLNTTQQFEWSFKNQKNFHLLKAFVKRKMKMHNTAVRGVIDIAALSIDLEYNKQKYQLNTVNKLT